MIRRVFSPNELSALPRKGVEAQKIRALLRSYGTKYDFCRFYASENAVLCEIDGDFVICETGNAPDIEELAGCFTFGGFSEIFCSEELGVPLAERMRCYSQRVNLMRFEGEPVPNTDDIEISPLLDEVYNILKTAFDIEYEPWYADMSHRIRHNVAKARKTDNSVLIIQPKPADAETLQGSSKRFVRSCRRARCFCSVRTHCCLFTVGLDLKRRR